MNKFLLLIFICIPYSLLGQGEFNNWLFGYQAGLNFNSGTPQYIPNGVHSFFEGCSSISDLNGNLLFYTDGITVYNKFNNIMPNGDSLAGGESSTQSALIIPYPGNSNLYFIFTVQSQLSTNEFSYSIVDITLNNGNGDVFIKNVFIASPIAEKIAAIRHPNNADYWVTVHGLGNNNFYSYKVDASGLNITPVISSVGITIPVDSLGYDNIGQLKFSSACSKIAYAGNESNHVALFDFDPYTGIVTNAIYLPLPQVAWPSTGAYGIEFSPSGEYLYCSIQAHKLYQWDITSGIDSIIDASRKKKLTSGSICGALQLAPDGKIYLARNLVSYLSVINYPDLQMPQCAYSDSGVYLGSGNNAIYGLPGFAVNSCQLMGINSLNPETDLSIFPNPTTTKLNIIKNNIKSIIILNAIGKIIFEHKYDGFDMNHVDIDTSFLSSGVYIIKIDNQTRKFFIF